MNFPEVCGILNLKKRSSFCKNILLFLYCFIDKVLRYGGIQMNRMAGRKKKINVYRLQFGWILAAVLSVVVIIVCGQRLLSFNRNHNNSSLDYGNTSGGGTELGAGGNTTGKTPEEGGSTEKVGDLTDITGNPNSDGEKGSISDSQGGDSTQVSDGNTPDGSDELGGKPSDTSDLASKTQDPDSKNPNQPAPSEGTKREDGDGSEDQKQEKKLVAFTFDDGPYPAVTQRILDVMEENGAKATFFVMGNRMSLYPDTVKRAVELGCEIGNHSYSHKNLTKLDKEGIIYEVEYSNDCINEAEKVGNVLLRPPYGERNELVNQTVKVPMIAWSVDSEDWKSRNKDTIIEEITKNLHDGDIVLMHDLYPTTADAVEYLVPELIKQGYEFVTVSELFERRGIEIKAGELYRKASPK